MRKGCFIWRGALRHFVFVSVAWASLVLGSGLPAAPAEPATAAQLSPEQLLGSTARDLAAHFNLQGDLQLELARPWSPPAKTAGEWRIAVLEFPAVASSSMLVRCGLTADGAAAGEVVLVVRAWLWRDAWVARQPIAAGASFDPAALETRRVDMFRERDALPATAGDGSFLYARAVGAGRTLGWRDIVRRPLVKRGELVEVSAASGALLVTMKALAMENGARGETISVRNPESHKNFPATVVDEKRVEVRF